MNEALEGLRDIICAVYLDDVLCYGKTFDEHLTNVKTVLQRLKSKGMKLKASKCNFFKRKVVYLGRIISKDGYQADPAAMSDIEHLRKNPKTLGELRSLIGFFGYYRTFVRDFARKIHPLYELLKTTTSKLKDRPHKNSKHPILWGKEHQGVLEEMINILQSPEVMAFPDFSIPFIVDCDASQKGLGAVLYQKQEDKMKVIAYASRSLTTSEKNYHLHSGKLEFLALKWSVTEKFRDYLGYGPPFTILTDNNPLTYVMSTAKLHATGLRWVSDLANFQFSIKYRQGKQSVDCDFLSRNPKAVDQYNNTLSQEEISTIMTSTKHPVHLQMLQADVAICSSLDYLGISNEIVSKDDLVGQQKNDKIIGPLYSLVSNLTKPTISERKLLQKKTRTMLKQFDKFKLKEDVLIRQTSKYGNQVVLPRKYHLTIYEELHSKISHLGAEKVIELCRQRFYWPGMARDVNFYIRNQCGCLKDKKPNRQEKAELTPIEASRPFQFVSIDYLKLDMCKGGFEYVLVVVDHFTRFVQAYGTKNKSGRSAAEKLFNEFFLKYGFPERLHHDQGKEFNNNLFKRLNQLSGIKDSRTTPYHPMGNGQVERMNRTLINMLKSLPEKYKNNWKNELSKLTFAYNSTTCRSTGFPPFYLLFGRHSRLPIDVMFGLEAVKEGESYQKFVQTWKEALQAAAQLASATAKNDKTNYDKKARAKDISEGDRVLVKNLTERGGTGKLRSHWEKYVHTVKSKVENLPVFVVIREDGKGVERRMHRNLLLKCDYLPLENIDESRIQATEDRDIDFYVDAGIDNNKKNTDDVPDRSASKDNLVIINSFDDKTIDTDDTDNEESDESSLPIRDNLVIANTSDDKIIDTDDTDNEESDESTPMIRHTRVRRKPIRYRSESDRESLEEKKKKKIHKQKQSKRIMSGGQQQNKNEDRWYSSEIDRESLEEKKKKKIHKQKQSKRIMSGGQQQNKNEDRWYSSEIDSDDLEEKKKKKIHKQKQSKRIMSGGQQQNKNEDRRYSSEIDSDSLGEKKKKKNEASDGSTTMIRHTRVRRKPRRYRSESDSDEMLMTRDTRVLRNEIPMKRDTRVQRKPRKYSSENDREDLEQKKKKKTTEIVQAHRVGRTATKQEMNVTSTKEKDRYDGMKGNVLRISKRMRRKPARYASDENAI